MRLDDVQAAQPADALVALLDFPPDVPGTAADLPFVHAQVAAERAAGGCDGAAAPAAARSPSTPSAAFTSAAAPRWGSRAPIRPPTSPSWSKRCSRCCG